MVRPRGVHFENPMVPGWTPDWAGSCPLRLDPTLVARVVFSWLGFSLVVPSWTVPTFTQVVRRGRSRPGGYDRSPAMEGRPQRTGICLRVGTTKPKKPNSAIRKVAKVSLPGGVAVRAVIPGAGFDISEHSTVVVRAGRARDIPGIHYRLVRSRADLGPPTGFERHNRRSKFGVPNWVYIIRDVDGLVTQVVSQSQRLRQRTQTELNLPLTWGGPPVYTLAVPARAVAVSAPNKEKAAA